MKNPNKRNQVFLFDFFVFFAFFLIFRFFYRYFLFLFNSNDFVTKDNQKSLLSFFVKKSPRKSDIKLQPKEKEERKSLFRCVGFSPLNAYQQKKHNESLNFLESLVKNINALQINPEEILSILKENTKKCKLPQRKPQNSKKNRKLYLFLHDSLRKYNGIVCELVASRVKGRKPLEKEDCINYEVDSDEELEEQVLFFSYSKKN